MTSRLVHLGFEVDTGRPVEIPISHMAVFGQTQKSGKTTALEALISRANTPAIAFLTKRGEGGFQNARKILPYFKENADWHFVQTILESVMRQDQKFKQPWIIRACEGAKTLADVQKRAGKLEKAATHSMSQDMYMVLGEYLKKVVPIIAQLPKTSTVHLSPGLSVMDLIAYPFELQILVIASTLDWIYEHAVGVITVIPEAWKFVPERRNTPVKVVAEKLVREGAGLKNFVWIDSQDMAGVDKLQLRACSTWLVGVQREANEVKRSLANMEGRKKPKAADVVTLGLGQFFACFDDQVHKTYVQPAWMDEKAASQIAAGRLSVHDVPYSVAHTIARLAPVVQNQESTEEKAPALPATAGAQVAGSLPLGSADVLSPRSSVESRSELRTSAQFALAKGEEMADQMLVDALRRAVKLIENGEISTGVSVLRSAIGDTTQPDPRLSNGDAREYSAQESLDNEQLYQSFKSRLLKEAPGLVLSLTKRVPEIEVKEVREKIALDTTSTEGRIAYLIHKGFFDINRMNADVVTELGRRGWPTLAPTVGNGLRALAEKGFLIAKEKGRYCVVEEMKGNITAA